MIGYLSKRAESCSHPKHPGELFGVGSTALLNEPLLGLLASRECPGSVLLETLDRVPQWVKENRVILSGFHSPLEQQVLRSVLRRQGRVIKLLARGLTEYRAPSDEREALNDGRLLVLKACSPEVRRTTRATSIERNRLVLALASEVLAPHIAKGSPLAVLLSERDTKKTPAQSNAG
ncbi:MAG: hypothetical protein F4X09_11885 [Gammaproteobacteria bacterium]|nr:hypothetical protein [Gammaproteobacteria bacterium]